MKRLFAWLLACVLLSSALLIPGAVVPARAATMAELEQEIDRLESEIKANKQKLSDLADKKESQEEYLETLQGEISAVEKKADALETQIQTLDNEILTYDNRLKQLSNEIAVLEDEVALATQQILETRRAIDNSKDELSAKLRASYITGNNNMLKILMGAHSLAGFLTKLEMMKRMSENDRRVIDQFKEQVETLRDARISLEKKQSDLEEKHAAVEATRQKSVDKKNELKTKKAAYQATVDQLESDYADVESYISKLDKDSAAYQNYQKKMLEEKAAADRELDELIRSLTTTTAPTSIANGDPSNYTTTQAPYVSNATWAWPLGNASCYISSGFGNRSASISGWSFHGGIDIAGGGIYGKPVFASRSGYVAGAIWGTTGYGRYVVLDHGDGFATIYGHCSNLTVSEGQYVNQGYQIANVGSTGNSTGPHLHFEIRYNGEKQNPLNYVSAP